MAKQEESQVFINFYRSDVLSGGFVDNLEKALKSDGVNVFADALTNGDFKGIEDSRIALVVFSSRYTESRLCLDELVKIKEGMEEGKIMVIPIFYKLDISVVEGFEGEGGFDLNLLNPALRDFEVEQLMIWKEALDSVSCMMGFQLRKNSDESKFITRIVKDVKRMLNQMAMVEKISKSHDREEQNDDFMNSSKSERLDGESYGILLDAKSDKNPKDGLESVQGEAELCGKLVSDDIFLGDIQDSVENQRVDLASEEKKQGKVSISSTMVTYKPLPQHNVFINFRGTDLRDGFVSKLVEALKRVDYNVDIDEDELAPRDNTELLCKRIEESRIAIVIFTNSYTESTRCLDELVKIKERMDEGKLLIIPIFYKVKQLQVNQLQGNFGVRLWNLWRINREHRIIRWKEALEYVGGMMGFQFEEHSGERKFITRIVKEVMNHRDDISLQGPENPSFFPSAGRGESIELSTGKEENHDTYLNKPHLFGMELRMEQLEQKLGFDYDVTRIIGVVGMPGIGKTTLAKKLYEKWTYNFVRCIPLLGIHKKSKDYELVWLRKTILQVLLEGKIPVIDDETTHESVKHILLQTKVFVVLDDVSDKKQLDFLLGNLDWIKKGSKIIITTSDQSLLKGFAHDTYVVPLLNNKEAFQLFTCLTSDDKIGSLSQTFLILSRKFVDYAGGHPQTLILLGTELHGKDEAHWEHRLGKITDCDNTRIQDVWRISTDQLNEQQKDVFLDIVYFFRSEDEYFVRSLLDSGDPGATDSASELTDLTDKFLITISDGRVEMNDLLYSFSKGLNFPLRHMLWNYKDIEKPEKMNETEANNVRGIFLDMSEVTKSIPLDNKTFTNMRNLRYLKIYDSSCPRQCKDDCKLELKNELELCLEEIRYLHWVQFPLKELPPDFTPKNLVDLRLPYSKIERVSEAVKDTPRLKWVDLCHSSKLLDLSALSKAENLQRLNLEGCTVLNELPAEIQNMKSLVFLNLRGCISLRSFPTVDLISLQTLILSDCLNLEEFQLISKSVEFLYLDGTAIKELPPDIQKLQRLVVLNLKNCKMLECLPKCLGELKALEELTLSGCKGLKNLSDIRESVKHLQSLHIDDIGEGQASEIMFLHGPSGWPRCADEVSSLRRLSLSGNDFVSLQTDVWKLYNLNWLDVTECKKLKSIPMLPPRLQYFDAHGCDSLESVANPLAIPVLTHQIHATFNFSNCKKLDQDAKDSIISYNWWKAQSVLNTLYRYNGGSVLEVLIGTCFPGWDVPTWFSHRASGSVLRPKLPPHWSENKFTGIALCAVIVFPNYHEQRSRLLVKCNCVVNDEGGSRILFSCTVGSWSEPNNTPRKHDSSHVFIGYATMLDKNKHGLWDKGGCVSPEASLEFQVTDGTKEVGSCEVLNCGFRLIDASDERENTCWDAKKKFLSEAKSDAETEFQKSLENKRIENAPVEGKYHENCRSHDDIQSESYCDVTLETEDSFLSEAKSDANSAFQKSLENKRIENVPVEAKSHKNSRSHDAIQFESYYDLTLGTEDLLLSEAKSDAKPELQKSLEDKRDDLLNVNNDVGGEITVSSDHDNTSSGNIQKRKMGYFVGVERRLKQMERMLYSKPGDTCIVGVVGMAGIGKTTLATILFKRRGSKFPSHLFLKMSKECRPEQLRRMFLKSLLTHVKQNISDETTHEFMKDELLQTKVFVVLDDVSDKKQLEFLLGNLTWIKKGSKIIITTRDKSLLGGFAHDTFVVLPLDNKESFQLLTHQVPYNQICSSAKFLWLSRMFVENAGGNPLALKLFGSILCGKKEFGLEQELQSARESFKKKMIKIWINQLSGHQKDVFLDIKSFFKSEDEYFARSLLDSGNSDAESEVRVLADKLFITISGGRVEVHDQLNTLSKELSSPGWLRLLNYKDTIRYLKNKKQKEACNVRGIFLDMSEVTESIPLDNKTFTNMCNLRYLKIYDSSCPRQCRADCKLHFPDGLEFPLKEVRYLHWVKFPLEELPPDFRPENLVDLRLPHSKIERVWEAVKDTPRLKWVDLRHSSKLLDLSALSKAENLQRLNLEGCTSLDELPAEIQNMKSLVFLNLQGCIRLQSLPTMNLISLQTLILSDCSNLKKFQVISECVEFLYLDGTAIKELPPAIQKLQRLVVLNLKNCKMLECLPKCLGELKALEELILSGCIGLRNLSDIRDSMKHLQSLLIDSIGAKEMPNISSTHISEGQASEIMFLHGPSGWPCGADEVSSLRRLSLSGNDFVSLQTDIWKLYNLNWLDVTECKMLRSIPMLPPRLQYFDAHGCVSLESVANPLAVPVLTHQIHATFIFSNCTKLDQVAKDNIISYTRRKSQLVLDALPRCNGGSVLEALIGTCFPGWDVPAWFSHRASGSVLQPELPPHWSDNKFTGIALCAVIRFPDHHEQKNHLVVESNCEFNNEDGSCFRFSCRVGSWSDPGKTPGKIVPSHVFIGYVGNWDIKKHGKEEDEDGCSHTMTSFTFQVTDGTEVLNDYEVLKCGFSLVYASDELHVKFGGRGTPVEANHYGSYSNKVSRQLDGGQSPNTKSHVIPAEYKPRLNNLRRDTEQPRVIVSCHGNDLCLTFVKNLVSTLTDARVNVFIDNDERMWTKMQQLYHRIEDSKIAVVIFSKKYLRSGCCLNELVKIDELAKEGKILVIPVFYQVISSDMENLKEELDKCIQEMRLKYENEPENVLKWEISLMSIAKAIGIHSKVYGTDASLVKATVEAVQRELTKVSGGNLKSLGRRIMAVLPVFLFALFAAFLFCLFVAPLLFTDAKFSAFCTDASLVKATVEAVQRELTKISGGNLKSLGRGIMATGPVFLFALFAAFLFCLFVAPLLFTDAKFSAFRTDAFLVKGTVEAVQRELTKISGGNLKSLGRGIMATRPVFLFALFAAFLFCLFVAPLLFTDAKFSAFR